MFYSEVRLERFNSTDFIFLNAETFLQVLPIKYTLISSLTYQALTRMLKRLCSVYFLVQF